MRVRATFPKALDLLVVGDAASPGKLERARRAGARVVDRVGFEHLLATGEIREVDATPGEAATASSAASSAAA